MVFGGTLNAVRSPYERSTGGRLSSAMMKFFDQFLWPH